jgi:hypothetical protein
MRWSLLLIPLLLFACNNRSSGPASRPKPSTVTRMKRYTYLVTDGGPHLLLPAAVASAWTGNPSKAVAIDPQSDFGRACAATASARMALLPVASGNAMVFADPPMTAWGKSADGLVEIYYLDSWTTTDLDALIDTATASLPTPSLTDTGLKLQLTSPDAFLLFAGDTLTHTAYGTCRIPLPAGNYRILTATYTKGPDSLNLYRLAPITP